MGCDKLIKGRCQMAWKPILEPAEERDWMGWPQFGMERPTFDGLPNRSMRTTTFGNPRFWYQEDRYHEPIEITEEQYLKFVEGNDATNVQDTR